MPKADFNQEFPTRASLRRAREKQEAEREQTDAVEKVASKNAEPDVFDTVPESNRAQPQKPSVPLEPKPGKQAPNGTTTAKPVVENNAQAKKSLSDASAAAAGSAKAQTPNQPAEVKPTATPKPAVSEAAKSPAVKPAQAAKPEASKAVPAKPAAPSAPKTEAKQPANAKPAVAPAPTPEGVKPAAAKPTAAKPAEVSKQPVATAKPETAKATATPATKPAASAAVSTPAPAKPAPTAAKTAVTPAPATKPAPAKTEPAKPAPEAAKPVAKPAAAAKPTQAKTEPSKAAPVEASKTPVKAATDAKENPELSLSTAEGRRQAFRELNPSAGERDTFLRPEDETSFRAERGFRGFLSRMGFTVAPSAQEIEERSWRRTVGSRLNEPKTISVVNGKGGANKTPTAVLLSAVFGRNSGDPVLVWDNNGTRGTLGWRTLKGSHNRHSMDLLASSDQLKETRVGDPAVNDFVHYQPEDCYSVLRTDPTLLASEQHVNAADFDVLHEIVSRFFSLTIVDSGNDESAERWLRMIDHTDQLVIASTTVEEHAEAGALLLEALAKRGGRYEELAKNAVVIISQHQPQGNDEQLNRIAHGFRRLARQVVTVPYDAALVKGQIRFDGLRPATRRAWLHATAAVAGAMHN